MQEAFEKIKMTMIQAVTLSYPNYEYEFEIHTDASAYQLGGVISQRGNPLAFYSRKLNSAQMNYSVIELELLSIVEVLREFRGILLGRKIIIFTDHKNLASANFKQGRVLRWRLLIEEFGPEIRYIKGEDNKAADALSRLNLKAEDKDLIYAVEEIFPLATKVIAAHQGKDTKLQESLKSKPDQYQSMEIEDISIIQTKKNQYVIPTSLVPEVLEFYHVTLNHPGATKCMQR